MRGSWLRLALRFVAVLGLVSVVVPNPSVRPATISLTTVETARAVDFGDGVLWVLALGSDARAGTDVEQGLLPTPDDAAAAGSASSDGAAGPIEVLGEGPLVVREKTHPAAPMTLDQALYEMELVGHDFFLFVDKESERPSVVYRRRGYDYGVISLDVS